MSKIDFDPVALEGCISDLSKLYSDLSSAEAFPTGADISLTHRKMHEEYEDLLAAQKSLLQLIEATVSALKYAKKTMVMADESTAEGIKTIG